MKRLLIVAGAALIASASHAQTLSPAKIWEERMTVECDAGEERACDDLDFYYRDYDPSDAARGMD